MIYAIYHVCMNTSLLQKTWVSLSSPLPSIAAGPCFCLGVQKHRCTGATPVKGYCAPGLLSFGSKCQLITLPYAFRFEPRSATPSMSGKPLSGG